MGNKVVIALVSSMLVPIIAGAMAYGEVKGKVAKNEENITRIYSQLEKQDIKLDKMLEILIQR